MSPRIKEILEPARNVLATLPRLVATARNTGKTSTVDTFRGVPVESLPAFTTFENGECKVRQSKRTYYLGMNGRVSQRKRLVGEVAATVRAFTTDHARFQFSEAQLNGVPTPHIGKQLNSEQFTALNIDLRSALRRGSKGEKLSDGHFDGIMQ